MEGWVQEFILPIFHSSTLLPKVVRAASPTISAFADTPTRRYADTALSWLQLRRAMYSVVCSVFGV
jgi:hypothetical protein